MPKHSAMGLRLRAAIERSAYSQTELARLVGISQGYIARMLAGDRSGGGKMAKMAELLNVHERWLCFGDEDVRPAWAIPGETLDQLKQLTKRVRESPAVAYGGSFNEQMLGLMREILAEQRRTRAALEHLAPRRSDDAQNDEPLGSIQQPALEDQSDEASIADRKMSETDGEQIDQLRQQTIKLAGALVQLTDEVRSQHPGHSGPRMRSKLPEGQRILVRAKSEIVEQRQPHKVPQADIEGH